MAAPKRNAGSGKHFEGFDPEATGYAGPSRHLGKSGAYEPMGVHRSAPNPKPTVVGGRSDKRDGTEEKGFDLHGKGYSGPQNWTPTNLGVRNPDDIS